MLHRLRTWVAMVQGAGGDLHIYWKSESEVWAALGVSQSDCASMFDYLWDLHPTRLLYNARADSLSLECQNSRLIQLYKLQIPAGSYPRDPHIPTLIGWDPRLRDEDEGSLEASLEVRTA